MPMKGKKNRRMSKQWPPWMICGRVIFPKPVCFLATVRLPHSFNSIFLGIVWLSRGFVIKRLFSTSFHHIHHPISILHSTLLRLGFRLEVERVNRSADLQGFYVIFFIDRFKGVNWLSISLLFSSLLWLSLDLYFVILIIFCCFDFGFMQILTMFLVWC